MAEYAVVIGAVAAVVAVGLSAYATSEQLAAQRRQARAQHDQQKFEAEAAAENAAFQEKQHRRRLGIIAGEQQATLAAAGLDTGSGTPLVNEVDLTTQGELEALSLRRQGALASEGHMFEAGILSMRERQLKQAATYSAIGSGLQGVSAGATGYAAYRQTTTQAN